MMLPLNDGVLQFFDVDHGACALLTIPGVDGVVHRILIDCGHLSDSNGMPWYPGTHLRNIGVSKVDLLVCTNYDEDHASGAVNLAEEGVKVDYILGNPSVPAAVIKHLKSEDGMGPGINIIVNTLAKIEANGGQGNPPAFSNVSYRFFYNQWPYWDTENNLSFIFYLNIRGFTFLFTGDIEHDGLRNLLRLHDFAALMPSLDVLVAPHHGRANGVCEELFDDFGANPQLIVISDCAKRYQSQETVQYYQSKAKGVYGFRGTAGNRFVLTTRSDGEIRFEFHGERCFVK